MDNANFSFLATVLLAPIFWLQGKYVRWVTPKLAEPIGARVGKEGTGKTISLLIAGDSAGVGVGVAEQQQALSGQLVDKLAQQFEVNWCLEAKNGDNSLDLLNRLHSIKALNIDYVILSIGVNDVTKRTSSQQWLDNLDQIIALLKNKFDAKHILFTAIPPVHAFPALPNPLRWWLGQRAKRLNMLLQTMISQQSSVEFIKIPFEFDVNMMADDGFHPGAIAYQVWGKDMALRIMTIEHSASKVV